MPKLKSNLKLKEAEELKKNLDRLEKEAEQEKQAELNLLDEVEKKIQTVAKEEDLFCGIILTPKDIVNLFELALTTKENIKIPFKLYYTE